MERPQLIREAERRIFGLEVVEEKLVVAALEAGLEVHRRPGASAWAILGLRGCGGGSTGRGGGLIFPGIRLAVPGADDHCAGVRNNSAEPAAADPKTFDHVTASSSSSCFQQSSNFF